MGFASADVTGASPVYGFFDSTCTHLASLFQADLFANVPQLHIVVAVDDIGFHLRFFSIYDNAMVTALCHDPGSIRRGSDASQQQAGKKTGCKTSSLHGVYLHIL